MKRIHFIAIILLLVLSNVLKAQALKVGDTVPDVEVANILNHASDKLRLSEFKKKLIILDFWATNCSGCISAFAQMDSLQKRFNQDIQIVLINQVTKDSTERFFKLRKRIFKPDLPFITSDSVFQKFFPHETVPYYVLLDSSLRVHYIPIAVTFAAVQNYLSGEKIGVQQNKPNEYLTSPVNEKVQKTLQYSSFLFKTTPELQVTTPHYPGMADVTLNVASIALLYAAAFDEERNYFQTAWNVRPGKVVLEMADRHKYMMPEDKEELYESWIQNYSYSYQLILPENQEKRRYEIMRQDLQRYFNLDAKVEKRYVNCLTLVRLSTEDKIKAKGEKVEDNFWITDSRAVQLDSVKTFSNKEYSIFSDRLSGIVDYWFKKPFQDATGFQKNKLISIQMSSDAIESFNLDSYRKELRKYDLDLVERRWLMDILVLRERDNKR